MKACGNCKALWPGIALAAVCAVTMTTSAADSGPVPPPAAAADLILSHGQIRTPSGWAEAVAIRAGIIVAVGDARAVGALQGGATRVIDLGGAAVLPGLHDAHVHALFAGMEQFQCSFPYGAAPPTIVATVKACVREKKPGEWIEGGNWVGAAFAPGQQTRALLDAVAPLNPVMLNDEAHHSVWVNSLALELAGITRATPDPEGGIIERDYAGEPTGLLRETATRLVERVVPEPSDENKRKALLLSTSQMLSYGITSFTDASVRVDNMAALSMLSAAGLLKQRVRGCIVWAPGNEEGERLIVERAIYATPKFATDCVKIFLDGVPTESHTAAMLAPYAGAAAHGSSRQDRGILMMPQPVLDAAVARFDRQGLHIKFHAVGDAAVRAAIDAVARARKTNGWGGSAHDVGHNSFVDLADIPRVRELHMTWEFSPYIWYPTPIVAVDVRKAVGKERMQRFIPIRDALETGALVVAGSDWSVVPSVNPWLAMETMVTREKPGSSKEVIAAEERIALEDAFRIFTVNGAALMGQRDKVGSIEVGMHADLIVTATNPFNAPITEVHDTKVRMTFIDGVLVFDAAAPPPLTAH